MVLDCLFRFDRIPEYIRMGRADLETDPLYEGEAYVNDELADLVLEAPPADAAAGPWEEAPVMRFWIWVEDPVGGQEPRETEFVRRRWYRDRDEAGEPLEVVELWQSGDALGDVFYAHRRGPWYLAISCIDWCPAVLTPQVSWWNRDGVINFEPERIAAAATVDELNAAMRAHGRAFVRDIQWHPPAHLAGLLLAGPLPPGDYM